MLQLLFILHTSTLRIEDVRLRSQLFDANSRLLPSCLTYRVPSDAGMPSIGWNGERPVSLRILAVPLIAVALLVAAATSPSVSSVVTNYTLARSSINTGPASSE